MQKCKNCNKITYSSKDKTTRFLTETPYRSDEPCRCIEEEPEHREL